MAAGHGGAIDDAHRSIIEVIQPVLAKYGYGLAGGNALRVHGLSTRPTRDVNMFTSREGAVKPAVPEVEAALRAAGFDVEFDNRGGHFARDYDDYDAQWLVTVGDRRIVLHLHVDETFPQPVVISGVGPVHDKEAVLGGKVIALVIRADARDFADVFEAMEQGWSAEALIALAWQLNPHDYDADHFTGVLPNLRQLPDFDFIQYGMSGQQVKRLRDLFERQWPARLE
ncbi:MAG: nucleotidyl transferase AbiEii/AbiGii toxin family protein [Streptosporangiaceae bacterium]